MIHMDISFILSDLPNIGFMNNSLKVYQFLGNTYFEVRLEYIFTILDK